MAGSDVLPISARVIIPLHEIMSAGTSCGGRGSILTHSAAACKREAAIRKLSRAAKLALGTQTAKPA